jgi:hypothetical protein
MSSAERRRELGDGFVDWSEVDPPSGAASASSSAWAPSRIGLVSSDRAVVAASRLIRRHTALVQCVSSTRAVSMQLRIPIRSLFQEHLDMPVTEAERHHLYESLKAHLGAASADTLMNLIPPIDWSELATKADIGRLDARIDVLGNRIDVLGDQIATMSTMMATKTDVKAEVSVMRADLLRTFGTWLFASQAAVIASVAVIIAVLG